jgi:hypothetical protein
MIITGRSMLAAAGVGGLVLGTVVLAGGVGVGLGLLTSSSASEPVAVASVAPSPTPTPVRPIAEQVDMTLRGDCTACHLTPDGGVGTKTIPALAHPLQGWTDCSSCHAADKLVQTAAGHAGIHADQCTVCHTKSSGPAPGRPHPAGLDLQCLSCHGTTKAHLPTTMAGWKDTTCWLCHRSTQETAPSVPHTLSLHVTCRSCHAAGKTGALPANHTTRTDETCTACHLADPAAAPVAPHDLASRAGMCGFCHDPSGKAPTLTSPLPSTLPNP